MTLKKFITYLIFIITGFFALYICFYKLGVAALDNWDEAWYADVTRNMIKNKDFFVLYWNHAVFLDKPPLYMWLSTIASKFMGLTEFSFRFTSAISGFLTIILVLIYSYRNFGLVPALISFSTLVFNNVFIYRARSGNLDSLLSLFFLLLYFLVVSNKKYKYVFIGIFLGLIYLTKLTVAIFPFLVFVLVEIIYERKKLYLNIPGYIKLLLAFAITIGVWLYIGTSKIGPSFYQYFLFHGDQGVSNISIAHFKWDYLGYAYYSLQRRFFWLFLLGITIALTKLKDKKYLLQILFACGLIIQLSFTAKNNNWYLLPSMAFWSMLIALATFSIFNLLKKFKYGSILIGVFLIISIYISYKTLNINIMSVIDTSGPESLKSISIKLDKLTNNNDIIVRLDHLYPTTVYYSDRKVISSYEGAKDSQLFISRQSLKKRINLKEIKWVVGKNEDMDKFLIDYLQTKYEIIKVGEETIFHIL